MFLRVKAGYKGFTLLEVMVASSIALTVFLSIFSTIMAVSALSSVSRAHVQASQLVKGSVEALHETAFDLIVDSTSTEVYSAGPDNQFGTADDLTGQLTVSIGDYLDMDNDGNVAEDAIDIDGDGVNDCYDGVATCNDPYAKPVRVSFTWTQRLWGNNQNYTISVDTLLAR